MAGAELVVHAWKEWGLQALVLLSFTLQVLLLILAEFRRRMNPGILWAFLWSAYLLADTTAIYVLGHLSAFTRSPEHELMVFWAPFLLLHLGGQDNITAYSIDDCRLWLRHLQTLVLQVAAAAYVLYESSIFSRGRSLLLPATILVFMIGVVMCGERVWALRCAGISASAMSEPGIGALARSEPGNVALARSEPGTGSPVRSGTRIEMVPPSSLSIVRQDTEGLLVVAHLLLGVSKDFLKVPLDVADFDWPLDTSHFNPQEMYKMAGMQLSLMHDLFYTKAEVMCSWYGLCIRIFSTMSTAITLLLFHLLLLLGDHHHKFNGYNTVDVSITYVLIGGAIILEVVSLWRAMFSSWTCALVLGRTRCTKPLGRGIMTLCRLVHAASLRGRFWSGSMGQHDLFDFSVARRASRISRIASRIASWMGVEDPWNILIYSRSIPISQEITDLVVEHVFNADRHSETSPYYITNSRGRAALQRIQETMDLSWTVDCNELEESILIWHIATNVHCRCYMSMHRGRVDMEYFRLVDAVKALSNYMLFLLAMRPNMLPPPANRDSYVELRSNIQRMPDRNLDSFLTREYLNEQGRADNETLRKGMGVAQVLLIDVPEKYGNLRLMLDVWVEILCYVAYRCTAYSHTKQLSNGGELITVIGLVLEHRRRHDRLGLRLGLKGATASGASSSSGGATASGAASSSGGATASGASSSSGGANRV